MSALELERASVDEGDHTNAGIDGCGVVDPPEPVQIGGGLAASVSVRRIDRGGSRGEVGQAAGSKPA